MTSREHRRLAQVLAGFPAFATCRPADLTALAAAGRVTSLPAHWTFVHEGTPADACYVLLDGHVKVRISGTDRADLGPGEVLGEMALLRRSLRTATIVSVTPVSALRVEYADLAALLDSRPSLHTTLGAVLRAHRASDLAAADPAGGG